MRLVAGLGNPGAEYRDTRHNVGFRVVDRFSARHGIEVSRTRFRSLLGAGVVGGERVLVAKPQTYMNLSGDALGEIVAFHKVELEEVLVVCDDIALPVGRLRFRASGSSGGQKGMESILRRLGTRDLPRLRLGIGAPPGRMDAADYVLGRFRPEEREEIDVAVEEAALAIDMWVIEGIQESMNRYNAERGRRGAGDERAELGEASE